MTPLRATTESTISLVLDELSDGIAVVNDDGIVLYVNPRAVALLAGNASQLRERGARIVVDESNAVALLDSSGLTRISFELQGGPIQWGDTNDARVVKLRPISPVNNRANSRT